MGHLPEIFQPHHSLVLDLPFRPSLRQRLLLAAVTPLAHALPVPRSKEIATLANRVATVSSDLPRRLLVNAIRESILLITGGWKQLDLSSLRHLPEPWMSTGRSTLFLSMHHGNWEWLAGILHHLRSDTLGVARSAHQRPGQRLLEHVRSYHHTPVVYDQRGVRTAHKTLRQGGLVAFLADQRPPTQGEPGVWMGLPTLISPLPRFWCQGIQPDIWIGHLLPGPTHYRLTLQCHSPTAIHAWDQVLDQAFLPLARRTPEWHFGFFHNRLVPRGTF